MYLSSAIDIDTDGPHHGKEQQGNQYWSRWGIKKFFMSQTKEESCKDDGDKSNCKGLGYYNSQ